MKKMVLWYLHPFFYSRYGSARGRWEFVWFTRTRVNPWFVRMGSRRQRICGAHPENTIYSAHPEIDAT
jgi:hypothetical protein